jgi:hypothetical protein
MAERVIKVSQKCESRTWSEVVGLADVTSIHAQIQIQIQMQMLIPEQHAWAGDTGKGLHGLFRGEVIVHMFILVAVVQAGKQLMPSSPYIMVSN